MPPALARLSTHIGPTVTTLLTAFLMAVGITAETRGKQSEANGLSDGTQSREIYQLDLQADL
jgi:hypothetical protein